LYTSVSIDNQSQNMLQVGPQDNLLVTVEHKFYVAIPFVGRILGTSYSSLGSVGPIQINVSDIYYIPIQESYTIRNEGEQLYPGY
jgi:hypothetical protein